MTALTVNAGYCSTDGTFLTTVTWEEFCTACRRSHIPAGLMKLKKKEFLALSKGVRR